MDEKHRLLLIADISGYTPFMRLHAMSLAHAQDIVTDLIEVLIAASGVPFKLCKIEGDAAFLYAPLPSDGDLSWLPKSVVRMQHAFHELRREIASTTVCVCGACQQAKELRVKFVAHAGPVHEHRSRGAVDLGGFEVIVAHRLLKVKVPAQEYLLATQAVVSRLSSDVVPLETELPDVGRAALGYVEFAAPRAGAPTALPLWRRWKISLKRTWRTLPAMAGLEKPCTDFRNLAEAAVAASRP